MPSAIAPQVDAPAPTVVRFDAPDASGTPTAYALVLSSTPRAMHAMGGMTFDAQAGLFALDPEEPFDPEQYLGRPLDLPTIRQAPRVGFIPRDQEDAALATFRGLFDRWPTGRAPELGNFSAGGALLMGFRFTPSGMLFAVEASVHLALVPGLDRQWREGYLLGSDLPLENVSERTWHSMGPAFNRAKDAVPIDYSRTAAFGTLGIMNNVSHLLSPTPEDDTRFPAMGLGPGATTRLSNAAAPVPALSQFLTFLRTEIETRELNDTMKATMTGTPDQARDASPRRPGLSR